MVCGLVAPRGSARHRVALRHHVTPSGRMRCKPKWSFKKNLHGEICGNWACIFWRGVRGAFGGGCENPGPLSRNFWEGMGGNTLKKCDTKQHKKNLEKHKKRLVAKWVRTFLLERTKGFNLLREMFSHAVIL